MSTRAAAAYHRLVDVHTRFVSDELVGDSKRGSFLNSPFVMSYILHGLLCISRPRFRRDHINHRETSELDSSSSSTRVFDGFFGPMGVSTSLGGPSPHLHELIRAGWAWRLASPHRGLPHTMPSPAQIALRDALLRVSPKSAPKSLFATKVGHNSRGQLVGSGRRGLLGGYDPSERAHASGE